MAKRNRRRPVGRGSVYAERGQWRAQLMVNGRRIRQRAESEDEAWDALEELRRAAVAGIDIDRTTYTIGALLRDWLRHGEHVKQWTPATIDDYRGIV